MSAPVKERPVVRRSKASCLVSRETSLQTLRQTRAEIEQELFGMFQRMEPWSLPRHAYGAVEVSEEYLKAFHAGIKAYRALLKYVNAAIKAGEAAQ